MLTALLLSLLVLIKMGAARIVARKPVELAPQLGIHPIDPS